MLLLGLRHLCENLEDIGRVKRSTEETQIDMCMNYDTTKHMVKTICEIFHKGITPSEYTKHHSSMYDINIRIESS